MQHSIPAADHRRIGTTDLLKAAAILLVVVDHYGAFLAPDEIWWRIFGRAAAPVFFFLVGFTGARPVPMRWLALGAAMTAMNLVYFGDGGLFLNILFSLALVRLALPVMESRLATHGSVMVLLVVLAVVAPAVGAVIEYGSVGWMWALLGFCVSRMRSAQPESSAAWRRTAVIVGATTCGLHAILQFVGIDADGAFQFYALAAVICGVGWMLFHFRRAPLPVQVPAPVAGVLTFLGRRTLEIYAFTTIGMQALSLSLS